MKTVIYLFVLVVFLYGSLSNIKKTMVDPIIDMKEKKNPDNYTEDGEYIRPYNTTKIILYALGIVLAGIIIGTIVSNSL